MDLALLLLIGKVAVEYGILGFGWVLAIILLWKGHKGKEGAIKNLDEVNQRALSAEKKLVETKDEYVQELSKLHDKYTEFLQKSSEDRIKDLKEISEDYNELASDTVRTLDKLIIALDASKNSKK